MKKRILIFSTAYFPFIGGAEVAIKEITSRIAQGYECDLVTVRMDAKLPKKETMGVVTVYRVGVGIPLLDKLWAPIGGALLARKLHRKNNYTLFWAMMVTYMSGAAYLANWILRKKVPIVLTIQEGDSEEYLETKWFGLVHRAWKAALKRARFVTVLSAYLEERARLLGARNISLVPNGVDIERFSNVSRRVARQKFGISESALVIVTTSRLVEKNGIDTAIQALASVPHAQFLIAGAGPLQGELEQLARKCNVADRVRFLGAVPYEEVQMIVAAGDVFVRASRSEGFGNSFIEAMAVGTPVVGTPVGGIPDFLTDALKHPTDGTGLLVPPDDPTFLASALNRLLTDASLRTALSNRARLFVRERYSWDTIAAKMDGAFMQALQTKEMPRVLIATGVFPPESGGPATYSKALLDMLPARGFGVDVLPFRKARKYPKIIRHTAYFFMLFGRARKADVVYAQDPVSVGLPAALVAFFLRKKFVLKMVGDYAWEQATQRSGYTGTIEQFQKEQLGFFASTLRSLERFVGKYADRVVVPSNYLRGIVLMWEVQKENISVIHNGIRPHEVGLKQVIRGLLKFKGELVISTGRLVPWKGFDTLIKVHAKMKKKRPNLKLLIVGDGPEGDVLEKLAKDLGVEDSVIFTHRVENSVLLRYMRAADVFVLNTKYEGFSHVLLEAATIGVPIVTTKTGGNPEFIDDGMNGYLVRPDDEKALEKRISALLDAPELRAKISTNAKRKVEKFSVPRMVDETAEVLRSVV